MEEVFNSIMHYLTPTSFGARRAINAALKEVNLGLACCHQGLIQRNGSFKDVIWSVTGRKCMDGECSITIRCSDKEIEDEYNNK